MEQMSVLDRFAGWVARRPDAVACVEGAVSVTYRELDERSGRLASVLRSRGVGRGSVVGVLLPRSVEFVVAVLAVLRAGGAYAPLDAAYPVDRLAYMVDDCAAHLVLCSAQTADTAAQLGADLVDLDSRAGTLDAAPVRPATDTVAPEDACYVIYTSGSTGRPKGVVVEHRNLDHLVAGQREALAMSEDDRVLQFASPSFDASVSEIFVTLCSGACLVVADRDEFVGPQLLQALERYEVTLVTLPPSLLAVVEPTRVPRLRIIVTAGEEVPTAVARRWSRVVTLVNGYGPTETTVAVSMGPIDEELLGAEGRVALGRPLPGVRVYVLDGQGRRLSPGEVGEICVGGAGVARGYLGAAGATDQRFTTDPFVDGGRMYRTGDLGAWRTDGQLDFHGRTDRQVQIRGYRVEPEDVEAALLQLPHITQCAVIARQRHTHTGTVDLAAFVVSAPGATTAPEPLRRASAAILPPHMIPTRITLLDRMPLTPAGKRDYTLLTQWAQTALETGPDETTGPPPDANTTQTMLWRLWSNVLDRTDFGLDDDFFTLGGNSLAAVQILAGLRSRGLELGFRGFRAAATVRGQALAAAVRDLGVPGGARMPRVERIPLTPQQQGIWMLERLEPESRAYVAQALVHLPDPLDATVLRSALARLVGRHAALRLALAPWSGRGVPSQREDPGCEPVLDVIDLDAHGRLPNGSTVRRDAAVRAQRPVDTTKPPLVTWVLYRYPDGRCVLLQTEHHLIHDGWSTTLLIEDLAALYRAKADGIPEPPLPGSYTEYALRGDHRSRADRATDGVVATLRGAPAETTLPLAGPRPSRRSGRGATYTSRLSCADTDAVAAAASRAGATPFAVFLAAFAVALRALTGQEDLVLGCGVANRDLEDDWRTAGMTVGVVPVRLRPTDEAGALVRDAQAALGFANDHGAVSLSDVVRQLGVPRVAGRPPVYQIMVSSQDSRRTGFDFGSAHRGSFEEVIGASSKTDLTVIVLPRTGTEPGSPDGTRFIWQYDTDVVDAATVVRAAALTHDIQRRLAEALLTGRETMKNDESTAARGSTVLDRFAGWVARRPDAVACVEGAVSVTYRELDERSGRLASVLRSRGVGWGSLVGVLLPRSVEFVVAVLAVLRAGGAYVPLDTAYPVDRLSFMVDDCAAHLVLCSAQTADTAAQLGSDVVDLDAEAGAVDAAPVWPATDTGAPDDACYVIYTSGSTGRPKGVVVEHRNLDHLVDAVIGNFKVHEESVGSLVSSPSFDAGVMELWSMLSAGATVWIAPDIRCTSPTDLAQQAAASGVTHCFVPTGLSASLAEAFTRIPGALEVLFTGGEALVASASERRFRLVNCYGPTECTVSATLGEVPNDLTGPAPLGRPLPGTRVYVLDGQGRRLGPGEVGEICVGGAGVARGYLGAAGSTDERFTTDPFVDGGRMYRTGDQGSWRTDGQLDFHGRTDRQVQVRGFRVELEDVEAGLLQLPDIAQCAVIARQRWTETRGRVVDLAAFVIPAPETTIAPEPLRQASAAILPPHMIPTRITLLDRMPLTVAGKRDYTLLTQWAQTALDTGPDETTGPPPDADGTQTMLWRLWSNVLDRTDFGLDDDFFALDGDSLAVIQLTDLVQQEGGRMLVEHAFEHRTIRALATAISSASVG